MNLFLELLLFLATLLYSYLEALVKLFVPVRRKSLSGELVLITGAGHGVGRATALEFAKRQSRLVLWDINKVKGTLTSSLRDLRVHGGFRDGRRAAPQRSPIAQPLPARSHRLPLGSSGWDAERQERVWPHSQQTMWGSGPTVTRCCSGGSRQHPAEHLREGKTCSGSLHLFSL